MEKNMQTVENQKNERIMPTAEIIQRNDFLTAKIEELLPQAENGHYDEINEYAEEQFDLHQKYAFFDVIFEENGLKGIKDVKGNIRVPALYTDFYELYDHLDQMNQHLVKLPVCAYNQDDKCALVTTDGLGTPLTPFIYDTISKNNFDPFFTAYKGEKKGLMKDDGTLLVPCEMDSIYESFNGLIQLEANGKFGVYTTWGLYVAPTYDEMEEKNEYLYVRKGETWGYIDEEGHFIDESDEEVLDEACCLNFMPE